MHLWIIIQGTIVLSTTAAGKRKIGPKKEMGQKYGSKSKSERHELEICGALTLVGVKEVFQSTGIPQFDYDGISGEEGCTCLGIPINVIRDVYKVNEVFKTNSERKNSSIVAALQESYEWLLKYSERRSVWHSIRNEFCFEYAHLSLNLTRKLQLAHYNQCGRCGRIGHDALDPFVCQLDGCETLPPLNKEEAEKRKEERKEKQKRNSTYLKSKKQVITLQIHF